MISDALAGQVRGVDRRRGDRPGGARELALLYDGSRGDDAELADRFSGPLTFGTAGLRGPLRPGRTA